MNPRFALSLAAVGLLATLPGVVSLTTADVSSAGRAAIVHLSDADAATTGTATTSTGSLYSFASVVEGKPVRWNPCAPIHWQFRSAGAPTYGITVVKQSVARLAAATGTTWVLDGTVSSTPTSTWLPTGTTSIRPVLIGWTDGAHSDLLHGQAPGVLGVTRTAWFGVTQDGRTTASIRAAVIALDRTDALPLNGPLSWRTVALHELAHAMGLSHAGNGHELMYPVLQPGLADLQSGDLQGLTRVGRSQGCIDVSS